MRGARKLIATCAGLFICCLSAPARADAIDGDWCSENGRHISINGPSVTTPKGVKMEGVYTRHRFIFTMPSADSDAGAVIDMVLQGETQVRVSIGEAAPQTWRRCPPGIS